MRYSAYDIHIHPLFVSMPRGFRFFDQSTSDENS